jgi:serine protease AprX
VTDRSASPDIYEPAAPDDLVSFAVVCQPASGASLERLRSTLTVESLDEYLPSEEVLAGVGDQLRELGFEVFDLPGPVVSARGSVARFQSVFHAELVRRTRTVTNSVSEKTTTSVVLKPDSLAPSAGPLRGALLISVMSRPHFVVPRLPSTTPKFSLHPPGDIAHLTCASATHRLSTALGNRATGEGIAVAVLDTGFALHPYYSDHGYRITRVAMNDTSDPEIDDDSHGTSILAGLFACAPDAHAYAIKIGADATLGFRYAMRIPNLRVISVSWVDDRAVGNTLPLELKPLELSILAAIRAGVTVVAAGGNGQPSTFPAMMPDVIAVGGVAVDGDDGITASRASSSFTSGIFPGRNVPDFCAIASTMWLPIPGDPPDWISAPGGTSCATTQVAGIAALLLQKSPRLTPAEIRRVMAETAEDVRDGTTRSGNRARLGTDRATGAGLVNALEAWQLV